jgi:hypothetical protein
MSPTSILTAVLALMMVALPVAAKKPERQAVAADTSEKFEVLVQAIHQQMAPGKRYEFLQESDRAKVNQSLDTMSALLARSGSVDSMSYDDRIALFNEQEFVNGLLAQNSDDREVCSYEKPVGSHLPVKRCSTVREINESRAISRRELGRAVADRRNMKVKGDMDARGPASQ